MLNVPMEPHHHPSHDSHEDETTEKPHPSRSLSVPRSIEEVALNGTYSECDDAIWNFIGPWKRAKPAEGEIHALREGSEGQKDRAHKQECLAVAHLAYLSPC